MWGVSAEMVGGAGEFAERLEVGRGNAWGGGGGRRGQRVKLEGEGGRGDGGSFGGRGSVRGRQLR